jgi:UDPglucose--hexose-1-phosphate uridylyltransferase
MPPDEATANPLPVLDLTHDVHRRYNPLTTEWVLVSPHRTARPWQGQTETPAVTAPQDHDPACFLCPGNPRAGGTVNPAYTSTFVFDNDFGALRPDSTRARTGDALLRAEGEAGICRVLCYSPLHHETLGTMSVAAIREVVDLWAVQYRELGRMSGINAVTIFENRGAMMGASSPHPHGQVWANATLPPEIDKESDGQERFLREHGVCLLCSYAARELAEVSRVVCANDQFIAVVPFWAVWPFETLVLPYAHRSDLGQLDEAARDAFAAILKSLNSAYDRLFNVSFPYTMGLHQRPTDGATHPHWHLHAHFYPPLLRSATVRKFMVGYELLAGPQRDISAEEAAARLRGVL